MTTRSSTLCLLPLLALCALAMSAPAQAQYQRTGGTSATLQIRFDSAPRWTAVRGTRVEMIDLDEQPDYDMFRYNGGYYVHDRDQWYMSRRASGQFTLIDERSVPVELSRVPRDHWRSYPSRWDRRDRRYDDGYATLDVTFRSTPRWVGIRGTRVRTIRMADRPDYDMFAYGGNYYVYNDSRWYMSRNWRGQFRLIENRSVPYELSRVPRSYWQAYPSDWSHRNGNYRDDRGRGRGRGRG